MVALSIEVFECLDCAFWCGRCSETSQQGRGRFNHIASSAACERFSSKAKGD